MNILEELHIKIQSLDIDEICVEAMVDHKEEIIDLNTSQLEAGLNKHGEAIFPEYESEEYAKLKKAMGSKAPFGIPDLKVEGDFYEGFYAESYLTNTEGMSGLFVDSHDSKSDKLESKYTGIFGIMPANNPELGEIITPTIQKKVINGIIN